MNQANYNTTPMDSQSATNLDGITDKIVNDMESCIRACEELSPDARVKKAKPEIALLRDLEMLRNLIDEIFKTDDKVNRTILMGTFGGDCMRIAKLDELFERMQFSGSNAADSRIAEARRRVQNVEGVLEDKGKSKALSDAKKARAAERLREIEEGRERSKSKISFGEKDDNTVQGSTSIGRFQDFSASQLSEWMYGDTAGGHLSELNPVRWHGPKPVAAVIKDFRDLSESDQERPIIFKVPAGVLSLGINVKNAKEAIETLERPIPLTCEWRWNDAATGWLAALNPARWSRVRTIDHTIHDLGYLPDDEKQRPVAVKVPAGIRSTEKTFGNCKDAIIHLERVRKMCMEWKIEFTLRGLLEDDLQMFHKLTQFDSVENAVDALNRNENLCMDGVCVVRSARIEEDVLLYRFDILYREDEMALVVNSFRPEGSEEFFTSSELGNSRSSRIFSDLSDVS